MMWTRIQKGIVVSIIFILSTLTCLAQTDPSDPPCDDLEGGPDSCPVPLDTWVFVLVIAAIVFATCHLYRKQQSALLK